MKSVTEKGFPASLNYAVTRGKGEFSFRFSQLVTAASYSEADVSARPNSLNLFYRPLSGTALFRKNFQLLLTWQNVVTASSPLSLFLCLEASCIHLWASSVSLFSMAITPS